VGETYTVYPNLKEARQCFKSKSVRVSLRIWFCSEDAETKKKKHFKVYELNMHVTRCTLCLIDRFEVCSVGLIVESRLGLLL